ncbi:MAG: DNA internalization-related competence protein ComEC/Rec2 [Pseudomonadota bacterium]
MNFILLFFVAGTAAFQLLPALPDPYWFGFAILLPVCWSYPKLRMVAALLGGFFWSFATASIQMSALLPSSLEGKDLIVTGVISSIPTTKTTIDRFEMDVSSLDSIDQVIRGPDKIRLSWYNSNRHLKPGQVWRLKVRLKRPRGFQNPGGFDYERWLFTHGIQATGYVRPWEGNQLQDLPFQGGWLDRSRQRLGVEIDSRMDDERSAALVKALAIGDRSGMSSDDWRVFATTGTSHLVAISGLHIGMVAGLAFFLGQWAWRRSEWLMLKLAATRAAVWMALGSATAYAALAGFSLPTQRALIMLSLGLGALLLGRSLSISRSLVLALFGVVLVDPFASFTAGFWLSFGAVAVILLAVGGRLRPPKGWRNWGRIQWVVGLGLAPLLFILFNKASLIAPLVNLILVPWFSLFLVPLVLVSVVSMSLPIPSEWLFRMAGFFVRETLDALDWLSRLPFALVFRPEFPVWAWLTAAVGVVLLLMPKGTPGRVLGLLLLAPILMFHPPGQHNGSFLFTLLDVGQGLSCVVETAEHVLVYDTGPAFPSGFNTAEAVLAPYLHSRGIEHIDQLIISNGDRDHAGGIHSLLREMEVKGVMAGEPLDGVDVEKCRMHRRWKWDGVTFEILHPHVDDVYGKANNRSCVLKITGDGGSILIAGDIEGKAERVLVQRHGDSLKSDILVVPHHGSKTSSTEPFVAHIDPDYVLIPAGYRNRFGFPHESVVERWRLSGSNLLNTAEAGAVQFQLEAGRPVSKPQLYRSTHQHFWSSSQFEE